MQLSPKHTYRDSAFVIRTQQLGDADKIVILLSRQYGLIHAVAKGARKNKSKFGARLEPFMLLDVSFVYKEKLSLLNQAVTKQAYSMPLMSQYDAFLLGAFLNELVEKFAKFSEFESYYFNLLHGAISALSRHRYPPVDTANAFMVRILNYSGWAYDPRNLRGSAGYSTEELERAITYCDALLNSTWDIIAREDFSHLSLAIFSALTDHVRAVLDLDLLSLPLVQKELFGGR